MPFSDTNRAEPEARAGGFHPPGRCLSQVEFGPLTAAQASAMLGRAVAVPMTLAEVTAAKPMTSVIEPTHVGQYL